MLAFYSSPYPVLSPVSFAYGDKVRTTMLMEACMGGRFTIAKLLLEAGANKRLKDYVSATFYADCVHIRS